MKNLVIISGIAIASGSIGTYMYKEWKKRIIAPTEASFNNGITEHFNMIIVPDLSNRIDTEEKSKPLSDLNIVEGILNDIDPIYLKSDRRMMNQQDRFQVGFTNQKLISKHNINMENLCIDFSRFDDNQRSRIDYITGKNTTTNLQQDINKFKTEFAQTYSKALEDMGGADIPSFLENLNTSQIKSKGSLKNKKTQDGKTLVQEYRNVIILITDGYIEADKYASDYSSQKVYPNLSEKRIEAFRKDYNERNNGRTCEVFFSEEAYGINPVQNELLKEVEILVLEIDDRSLNESGNSTKEISDYKIIKLFWEDWLTKSGVKRFELFTKASSKSEVQDHVNKFLQINN